MRLPFFQTKGEVWLFSVGTYHLDVPAFLLPETPVTTEWPAEWDMILRWYEQDNAAWDGGRNCIQIERQNTHWKDSRDVAYRNKQGNCIDSFRLIGFESQFHFKGCRP